MSTASALIETEKNQKMLGPVVVYLLGVVTGPVIKPVAKGAVKGTIKLGLQVKKLGREAASEVQGIAAEAKTEVVGVKATPVVATTKV